MSMKKLVLVAAVASGLGMGAAHAKADQGHGKVTFHGAIIDAACSIDGKSADQTVELGSITQKSLSGGGSSTPVPFVISLHDCDTSTAQNATVTFNGTAGDTIGGLDKSFTVTGAPAGAAGVTVTEIDGTVIEPNGTSQAVVLGNGDNDLHFQAFVQGSSTSDANPGEFTSVANFVMAYN